MAFRDVPRRKAVFSLATEGRSLTSGLYCATTPASIAISGNSVAQGKSNFRLSFSAMVVTSVRGNSGLGQNHGQTEIL